MGPLGVVAYAADGGIREDELLIPIDSRLPGRPFECSTQNSDPRGPRCGFSTKGTAWHTSTKGILTKRTAFLDSTKLFFGQNKQSAGVLGAGDGSLDFDFFG